MTDLLANLEMIIGLVAFVLFVIGIVRIHRATKSKNSFMMLISIVTLIISSSVYFIAWTAVKFYYTPDKSPDILSYFIASSEYIDVLIFLVGALGFYGFTKDYVNKRI